METIKVNMTPCEDVKTIHASQNDNEGREWGFILHNNGDVIDSSEITDQITFKAYKGGTEQLLPENGSVPVTSPFLGDIRYPQGLLTDQEFLYRESPTEEDGLAKITDIKGNTLVWNQLVQNGNFADKSNWIEANATFTVNNNVATMVASATYGNIEQILSVKANHMYFATCDIKLTTATNFNLIQFRPYVGVSIPCVSTTEWQTLSGMFIPTTDATVYYPRITDARASGWDAIQIRNCMVIDLTQMGLGVSSPSEFTSLFPKPYYDYCQGAMLSFGGRNVKFNQLVQNGNFADSSNWVAEGSATINSITNNTINVTTANAGNSGIAQISFPMTNGHKYLLVATIKTTGQTNISVSGLGSVLFNTNSFITKGGVFTWTASTGNQWSVRIRNFDANSATFEARNVMLIDLTEMFGVGNEPSAEGFRELFSNDYYEYTTGKYMNLGQPVSLKTTGKNLNPWQGVNYSAVADRTIFLKKGDYVLSTDNGNVISTDNLIYLCLVDSNGNIDTEGGITSQYLYLNGAKTFYYGGGNRNNVPFTLNRDSYVSLGFNNQIPTNFSAVQLEFGSVATDYEPYTESTISIPLDEFPNGMDGINDARDYKNETGYAKRIGQVDLGNIEWSYNPTYGMYSTGISNSIKKPLASSTRANAISTVGTFTDWATFYASGTSSGLWAINTSGYIGIATTETNSATFKNSVKGKYLVYELATPLENYGVIDLGTLTWSRETGTDQGHTFVRFRASVPNIKSAPSGRSVEGLLCTDPKYYLATTSVDYTYWKNTTSEIFMYDSAYATGADFKQAMQGVYLLYEKENPQGFTTATLVTENGEVALANENGVLVGKCNSDVSADAGFIEGKIKLSDEDGDVYSNKIQIHVERRPQ